MSLLNQTPQFPFKFNFPSNLISFLLLCFSFFLFYFFFFLYSFSNLMLHLLFGFFLFFLYFYLVSSSSISQIIKKKNECDSNLDLLSFLKLLPKNSMFYDLSSLPNLSGLVFHSCYYCCFCENFPYNDLTLFKYFLKISLVEELVFLACNHDTT